MSGPDTTPPIRKGTISGGRVSGEAVSLGRVARILAIRARSARGIGKNLDQTDHAGSGTLMPGHDPSISRICRVVKSEALPTNVFLPC